MRRKLLLSLILFVSLFYSGFLYAQTTIHTINFEVDGAGYTTTYGFRDSDNAYWMRFLDDHEQQMGPGTGDNHDFQNEISGYQGDYYFAGEDINNESGDSDDAKITSTDINVTAYQDLQVLLLLGAPGSGYDAGTDYIVVEYTFNGSTYTRLTSFTGTGAESVMREDTDNNNVGDGTQLTAALQQFSYSIPKLGNTLRIRIRAFSSAGGEEYVIDNIRVQGNTDTTAPTVVSITRADANPTKATSVNFTVVFSEVVTGVGTSDFAETGTANGTVSNVTGSGTTYTVTVNSVSGDGSLDLDVKTFADGATIDDLAGNDFTAGFTTGQTYTIDNTAPTVVLSDDQTDVLVRDANTVLITATFTDVNGLSASTPTITIGSLVTAVAMTATADPLVWTYSWDVPAGNNGAVSVSVAATDVVGNASAAATGVTSYTIDNIAPAVVLTDDHPDSFVKNGDVVAITATFTEINGLNGTPTITIGSGVTNAAMTATADPLVWTYTWNVGTGDGNASVSITAPDGAGNACAAPTGQNAYTLDNTAPTVVLSDNHPDALVGDNDNVIITATFTEANTPLATPAITIGTLVTNVSMTATADPLVWTYTWNVPAGNDGTVSVSVATTDVVGNANTAATGQTSYTIDNIAPTVVLSDDQTDVLVRDANTVLITATFSDANGLLGGTPAISIGSVVTGAAMTATADPLVWTYSWNVPSGNNGAAAVSISATDAAGNANAAATGVTSYTIDNIAPAVVLTDDHPDSFVKNGDVVEITATFTEANGLNGTPAITIGSGVTNAAMTATADPLVWTYTWNVGTGDGNASVSITAPDVAGNACAAPTGQNAYTLDNTAPAVVLSDNHADALVGDNDNVIITATFTEANTPLATPTITIGTLVTSVSMTATADPLVWTYTWNVPSGNDGAVSVSVATTDVVGNANSAATGQTSYTIDNIAPTVVLSDDQTDVLVRDANTVLITATFSDANGLLGGTPAITIGSVVTGAAMTATADPLVWTYSWNVPSGNNGAAAVSIAATDAAGNASAAATGVTSYTIDNIAPAVVLTDDHPDSFVKNGDVVEITATITEANGITGTPTITIGSIVTSVAMTATADPMVWTYTWNVGTGNTTAAVSVSGVTDATGNANAAATGQTSYTIDNTAPTVVLSDNHPDALVRDADNVIITATFTDANGIAPTPTITIGTLVSNASMTATGDPLVWTYTWDVPAGNDGGISVSVSAQDVAGNANTAATGQTSYTIDNTGPSVVLSHDHADGIVRDADNVTITATFTEANNLGGTPAITIGSVITNAAMSATADPLVWTYSWNVPSGNDGNASVSVAVTDVAGNGVSATSGQTAYIIDNTGPSVTLQDGHADQIVRDADNFIIQATFTEANGLNGTPTITIGGVVTNAPMTVFAPLVWRYTWDVPAGNDGSHAVSISVTDVAGNANSAPVATTGQTTYIIDNTPPTVSAVIRLDPQVNNTSTARFQVVFEDGATDAVTGINAADFEAFGTAISGTNITVSTVNAYTYNVNVENITSAGNLGLRVLSANIITDIAGNPLAAPVNGLDEYIMIFPEPSRHVTGFQVNPMSITYNAVTLTWTDAAGSPAPSKYLIVAKRNSSTPTHPVDHTPMPDQLDLIADGNTIAYQNVSHVGGANSATFSSLLSGADYTFWIYPYTNSGSDIDYKTDADIFTPQPLPSASATTPVAATASIGLGDFSTSVVPSTATTSGAAVRNFLFYIWDGSSATPDNAPVKVSKIVLSRHSTLDQIGDWTNAIASAELTVENSNGTFGPTKTTTDITADKITFNNLYDESTSEYFGRIPDNDYKYFHLKIILKPTLGGTLPADIDNLIFKIEAMNSATNMPLAPGSTQFSNTAQVVTAPDATVSVVATQLDFSTSPNTNQLVQINVTSTSAAPDFSTVPVVRARDVHGNTDKNFTGTITLENAGALPMTPASVAMTNGRANFPSTFRYLDAGDGRLTAKTTDLAANGLAPADGLSGPVTVSYSSATTVTSLAGLTPISTANYYAIPYRFTITDDGGPGGDGAPTRISQIKITKKASTNPIPDWREILDVDNLNGSGLGPAILYDGSTSYLNLSVTVNQDEIIFSNMLSTTASASILGLIGDSQPKTYQLYIMLKPSFGGTLPSTVDHMNFDFEIDPANITFSPQSSKISGLQLAVNSGPLDVDVAATTLAFTTQPPGTALVKSNLTTAPIVEALDRAMPFASGGAHYPYGNRDLDYASPVSVTNAGGLSMINQPAGISAGALTFPASFQYTSVGNGNGQLTLSPSVAASNGQVPAAAISNGVTVRSATSATLAALSTEPNLISSLENTSPGAAVFQFTIEDDGDAEDDGVDTKIRTISITAATGDEIASSSDYNWTHAIAGATLSDGSNTVNVASIDPNKLNFDLTTGDGPALGLVADGATETWTLRIWLRDDISTINPVLATEIDGLHFAFNVQTAQIDTDPEGTSIAAGQNEDSDDTKNEVDVDATQLDFTNAPASVSLNTNIVPPLLVEARDANGNRDVNFTGTITDFGDGPTTTINQPSGAFSAGTFTFPSNFQYSSDAGGAVGGGTLTLEATDADGAINGTSPSITVQSSYESQLAILTPAMPDPVINYITHQATGPAYDLTDANSRVLAELVLHDGDANGDVDGANTILNAFTISISNSSNIRNVALYTSGGVEIPGTEQVVNGAATVTFSGLTITATDINLPTPAQGSVNFLLRATFNNTDTDVRDGDLIDIRVTAATLGSGSRFIRSTGDPMGYDPTYIAGVSNGSSAPQQRIEVAATRLDFTTQPNTFEGIRRPLSVDPVVKARDANGIVDKDFNSAATLASAASLSNTSFVFVNGEVTLSGLEYTSTGNGTITITSNSLSSGSGGSTACSHVDVINVASSLATVGVVSSPNLPGGAVNRVIFGATIAAPYTAGGEPKLDKFIISFSNPVTNVLRNFRIFESTNNTGYDGADVDVTGSIGAVLTVGANSLTVDFPGGSPRSLNAPLTYFLMVDVEPTASGSTPKIQPILFNDDAHILVTQGSVYATSSTLGKEYTFASIFPPTLVSSYPASGQLNVDPNQPTIDLVFSVPVWSLDREILLYDKDAGTFVSLPALNGDHSGGAPALAGTIANPLRFDLPPLLPDRVYYITIAPGKKTSTEDPVGDGIVDESMNEFPGFSYSGTLYFKTANPNPPQLLAANVTNASGNGAVLNATFDQRGKAYFMVVPHNGAAPNNDEIKGTASTYLGPVLDRGSFEITQTMTASQFGLIDASLSLGTQYDVWMYAENDALPTPVPTTDPYGNDFVAGHAGPTLVFTTASSNPPTGPVVTNISFCKDSYQPLSAPILIVENNPGDFSNTGDQIFNVLLPTGFQFDVSLNSSNEPLYGTLLLSGADFVGSGSLKFINSSTLQVKFKNSGSSSQDRIAIAGLRVLATAATSGDIIRLGGNSLTTVMPDLTVLAKLNSYDASSLIIATNFTNRYTQEAYNSNLVTTIPDNYNSPSFNVELIPLLDAGDYGPSSFAGAGVNINQLNLSAVTKNTPFNITHTHTDNNGCLSKISVQYTVYDHTSAIKGLSLKFCAKNPNFPGSAPVNYPSLLQEVKFNNLAAHQMYNLTAKVPFDAAPLTPSTEKSQIIYGDDWNDLLATLPEVTASYQDPNDITRFYKDYKIDASKILNASALSGGAVPNPYSYFDEITPQGNTYYTGGSLGFVEFTGEYQNIANASVQVPLKQNVQFFLPAIPVVELSSHSFLDTSDPANPVGSGGPSNKGTPVFCREGGMININAYPAAAVGSSVGTFELWDVATNVRIAPTPLGAAVDGFTDNGNGTAILDPAKIWNNYTDIRIVYTYKENDSPCDGSGYQIIRIAPNPVAQFTALSTITPNTPAGTAYCEGIEVNFDAEASDISNGEIVHYKWNFTDEANPGNEPEGNENTAMKLTHTFTSSLEYNPELVVTSNYRCQSAPFTIPVKVGAVPEVAFTFDGVSTADQIRFRNESKIESHQTLDDGYLRLDWSYGHGSPEDTSDPTQLMNHRYTSAGKFNATLKVTSRLGCVSQLTKPVVIVPQVNLNNNTDAYFADFQTNNGDYQELSPTGTSSWQHGFPAAGTAIGSATDAGNRIWTTNLNGSYSPKERSALYTAAFDIHGLIRPIITFNSFRNLGQGDGVVLEYSIDNFNVADDERKKWIRLGEIKSTTLTSTGVNWYNGLSLPSKPGEQESGDNGWTGTDFEWRPSKHSLAEIPKEARHKVVFRFALASVSDNPTGDGFAIDEVRVGNGTRTVLIENFTNTASTDAAIKVVSDTLKNFQKSNEVGLEIIKLNYHVAFPGEDPFNIQNPLDPGARALYYGIATVPQTRLDGTFSTTPGPLFSQWGRPKFDSRILDLANANILVDAKIADNMLTISGTFQPLIDLTKPTVLHVAVVEKNISLTDNPELGSGRIRSGETEFEYVLRKMLPNGAGTKYSTPIAEGQTVEFGPFTWSNATFFKPQDDIHVVVFLQDEDSKVIYQSLITPSINDPGIVTGIEDLNEAFNVYPNPADKEMTVELPATATQHTTLRMYDQLGKVVEESYFEKGDSKKTIDTESLAGGVYLIQVETPKGMLRRKVMVTHRN